MLIEYSVILLANALLANAAALFPWPPRVVFLILLAYTLLGATLSFLRFMAPLWKEPAV